MQARGWRGHVLPAVLAAEDQQRSFAFVGRKNCMIISDAGCAHPDDAAVPTLEKVFRRILCYFFGWAISTSFFRRREGSVRLLNVALTKRNSVPMCGVPYHAAPSYISKLSRPAGGSPFATKTSERSRAKSSRATSPRH